MKKTVILIIGIVAVSLVVSTMMNKKAALKSREMALMTREEALGTLVFTKPSDELIKEKLTNLQYEVTQGGGTESPFANEYWDKYEAGLYVDIVTGEPLFLSKDKYKSGTGWPSFTRPIEETAVLEIGSDGFGFFGIEIKSTIGDSHLGHVFNDGPKDDGGLRYCMNSAALNFIPLEKMEEMGYGDFIELLE